MRAKVNNIFYSIQGESTDAGKPCIFVRFTGCTLRCKWCDTKYAFSEGKSMTPKEIVKEIKKYPCKLVEFTGGEPLLYKKVVIEVMKKLPLHDFMIETNNTIYIADLPSYAKKIIDVKCPSSGNPMPLEKGVGLENLTHLRNLNRLKDIDEVKFVVANGTDLAYAVWVIEEYLNEFNGPILFSPVWGQMNFQMLANFVRDEFPFDDRVRMQVQLHKIIWDPKQRGV